MLEPAVDPIFRAAMVTVRARARDLRPEFGCGVLPVRRALPLTGKPVVAVARHAYVGHIGGFHEFAERLGHLVERAGCDGQPGVGDFCRWVRGLGGYVDHAARAGGYDRQLDVAASTVDRVLGEGDAICDDDLLDGLPGRWVKDYLVTMLRLRGLDCWLALGGHGPERA